MSFLEASYIIKKSEEKYMNDWNQTRYIMYSVLQSQSTKTIIPTEVLAFPWEKKQDIEVADLPVRSREDLIKHALEMEKQINS